MEKASPGRGRPSVFPWSDAARAQRDLAGREPPRAVPPEPPRAAGAGRLAPDDPRVFTPLLLRGLALEPRFTPLSEPRGEAGALRTAPDEPRDGRVAPLLTVPLEERDFVGVPRMTLGDFVPELPGERYALPVPRLVPYTLVFTRGVPLRPAR